MSEPHGKHGKTGRTPKPRQRDVAVEPGGTTDEAGATTRPADPRICRICGERALDMKYHLQRVHPRSGRGKGPRRIELDSDTLDGLREVATLLTDARDSVFKEPLRAMQFIDRAREWVAWAGDRSKPRPSPRLPTSFTAGAAPRRHDMRAAPPRAAARDDDEHGGSH